VTNKGEIYFALYGADFNPDQVTEAIGITPSSIKRKANPSPKQSAWILSSGLRHGEVLDLYPVASELVQQLRPHQAAIQSAITTFGLTPVFQVVLSIPGTDSIPTPSLGFDQGVIAFVASVGATIDIDSYKH
jgi:hypothetical protein